MIERKSFLRIMKATIAGLRQTLTDPAANVQQTVIEELSEILGVERCVVFAIGTMESDGQRVRSCEIIAGVPPGEYESKLRQELPLAAHPDLEDAAAGGRVVVIADPRNDPRTRYFDKIIQETGISEIVYIPLCHEEDEQWAEVIVIDGLHGRRFDEDEIEFCCEVTELLKILLGREELMLQHLRDTVINRMVPLEGFAVKLRENLQATLSYVSIIYREAEEISSLLPRKLNKRL